MIRAESQSASPPATRHAEPRPGGASGATARRPRLLFLSQTLPYPPDGGIHIRTYNVMRLLARTFDVTALCFYRAAERPTPRHVEAGEAGLRPLGHVEAFAIPQEHSRARLLWDHLRSVALGRAYTDFAYESRPFRERLATLRTGDFDVAHIDSIDLCEYVPQLDGLPVACTHVDAQSVLLRRRARAQTSAWKRAYIDHQADLVERNERRWCPRMALNIAVSEVDMAVLARLAPAAPFTVVPNGVDVDAFRPEPGRDEGIVFVGTTGWFPNRDALGYFCDEILPLLRAAGERTPVRWVGRASEEERRHFRDRHGVELTGYVDDIRPYVHDASCYVVPLRVGGGTRVKILDAWAMGKAVVSTSIGCEGLAAVDGENILVRDTPAAFAQAVRDVLHDADLRRALGRAARATVERLYGWDVIGEGMTREYLALVERTARRPAGVAGA